MSIRTYIYACIRLSTKRFFDFNEICNVGRSRRVMHDGMQRDAIQGQGYELRKTDFA